MSLSHSALVAHVLQFAIVHALQTSVSFTKPSIHAVALPALSQVFEFAKAAHKSDFSAQYPSFGVKHFVALHVFAPVLHATHNLFAI